MNVYIYQAATPFPVQLHVFLYYLPTYTHISDIKSSNAILPCFDSLARLYDKPPVQVWSPTETCSVHEVDHVSASMPRNILHKANVSLLYLPPSSALSRLQWPLCSD